MRYMYILHMPAIFLSFSFQFCFRIYLSFWVIQFISITYPDTIETDFRIWIDAIWLCTDVEVLRIAYRHLIDVMFSGWRSSRCGSNGWYSSIFRTERWAGWSFGYAWCWQVQLLPFFINMTYLYQTIHFILVKLNC